MKSLIAANIHFLQQGIDLLESLSDKEYSFDDSNYFQSSMGKHMRHILDHYQSLVNGWHNKVDYDARQRNTKVEYDRNAAIDKCQQLIHQLTTFENSQSSLDQNILVKSNEDIDSPGSPWSSSSIKRELQFLISHTVHHYALIAFILLVQDVRVPEYFGVAPSTINYEKSVAAKR